LHGAPHDSVPPEAALKMPAGFTAAYHKGAVHFAWESAGHPGGHYRIACGTRPGVYERSYPATGRSLRISEFIPGRPFARNQHYYAHIEAIAADGEKSLPSEEISFRIQPQAELQYPGIPLELKIKVLWSNVRAMIKDYLL
jgi:hypothetical protein